jgi:hypothetical protein
MTRTSNNDNNTLKRQVELAKARLNDWPDWLLQSSGASAGRCADKAKIQSQIKDWEEKYNAKWDE